MISSFVVAGGLVVSRLEEPPLGGRHLDFIAAARPATYEKKMKRINLQRESWNRNKYIDLKAN